MINFQKNVALAPYTVFKIGGPAKYFCEVKNKEELMEALEWSARQNAPYFILGAGSNILVSDEGFPGLVIKMGLQELKIELGQKIFASAGVSMARVVNFTIENGFAGFEWGIGIPGTIGGSVFGNAGCYGSEMKDVVESVEVLASSSAHSFPDTNIFLVKNFSARAAAAVAAQGLENYVPSEDEARSKFGDASEPPERGSSARNLERARLPDCDFSYRHSIFKQHPEWIILGVTLNLKKGDTADSRAKVLEYTKKRALTQDIGDKCAGCIFKNFTPAGASEPISAAYLIDQAGLKGKTIGKAMVSQKHANYIVNTGGATAKDVKSLIQLIKSEVQKTHSVTLEEEIRVI